MGHHHGCRGDDSKDAKADYGCGMSEESRLPSR
jgi:hypothetical protein